MGNTTFEQVYKVFLSKITDDMYLILTPEETDNLLQELLISALYSFEFPRVNILDYDEAGQTFNVALSGEEINIIATYMVVEWIGQQLATVEMIRMKYSDSNFKFTSQANHLSKLIALKEYYKAEGIHLQRLYKRRKADSNGIFIPTVGEWNSEQ